jgi:hypothetical protein
MLSDIPPNDGLPRRSRFSRLGTQIRGKRFSSSNFSKSWACWRSVFLLPDARFVLISAASPIHTSIPVLRVAARTSVSSPWPPTPRVKTAVYRGVPHFSRPNGFISCIPTREVFSTRETATSRRVRFLGSDFAPFTRIREEQRHSGRYARAGADRGSTGGEPAGNRYLKLPPKEAETELSAYADFTPKCRAGF